MSKRIGFICIVLGVACLLGSVGFVAYNRWEATTAETKAQSLLIDVKTAIESNTQQTTTLTVGGYDCMGILSIPVLELELPVLADWSYAKLKKAPCQYYGSCNEANFVIAAHNYRSHFGRLSELEEGDLVVFTDVNGMAHQYKVAVLETLPKTATEEMIASGFDLSLYTCTYGGGSRVTVRCNRA